MREVRSNAVGLWKLASVAGKRSHPYGRDDNGGVSVGREEGDIEDHFSLFLPETGLFEAGSREV